MSAWTTCSFYFIRRKLFIGNYQLGPNQKKPNKNGDDLVNESIRFPQVLVIGPEGQQLGLMGKRQAMEIAYEKGLDLLCVAPNANPPVCKILDYGKYRFQAQKKAKEAKKNQKIVEIKEIQLTPQIGENDLQTKVKKAKEILTDGNKINVGVRFRGRQLAHKEVGEDVINRFILAVSELGTVEKDPALDGRWIKAVIGPKIKK